ncbi:hypothetical protein [Phenylobacterium sp.]|uniref:hypothetical protein n=1 Tax=Phenylobacterium sp. TaxID=1871053 RepID=UPI002CEC06D1|nr:hypothetical protein [Phenylobacterium sp.]HVI33606.1 hypothetical protein [Phenylobacterium sp.]
MLALILLLAAGLLAGAMNALAGGGTFAAFLSWAQVLPVAIGAVAGGYFGARIGQRLPAHTFRWAVLTVTYGTTAVSVWRLYA